MKHFTLFKHKATNTLEGSYICIIRDVCMMRDTALLRQLIYNFESITKSKRRGSIGGDETYIFDRII